MDSKNPSPSPNPTHAAMAAWFLGPKAENHDVLRMAFADIVDEVLQGRKDYFKDDPVRCAII
jgi:hypothetical protein